MKPLQAIVLLLGGSLGSSGLTAPGDVDLTFDPGSVINGPVQCVAVQSDGRMFIGGDFSSVSGAARNRLARLNQDGSADDTFNPGLGANGLVRTIAVRVDGKVLVGGLFTMINGISRNSIAQLNADGSLDVTFDSGTAANAAVNVVALQADGKALVCGMFTAINRVSRKHVARLNEDGSVDMSFDPGAGPNHWVSCMAVQPDGKILIGGTFTAINGTARGSISRLNADGTLDATFDPGTRANGSISSLALQANGRVLVGGFFTAFDTVPRRCIARLLENGSLDPSFDPGSGAAGEVVSIAVGSDRKCIVGGFFTDINGVARSRIARLNEDGGVDQSFDPGLGASALVRSVAFQVDGTVIVGGDFTTLNGSDRNYLGRLEADGSLDGAFNAGTGANTIVRSVILQPGGGVLVAGAFTSIHGTRRPSLARLHRNGSLDGTFAPGLVSGGLVLSMAAQSDGRVLVSGLFTSIGGTNTNRVARLNADGSVDDTFDPGVGPDDRVSSIAIQDDGKVLVGGNFRTFNGTSRGRIGRLNADGSVDATFNPSPGANNQVTSVAWQRDGKVLATGFFTSMNGISRNRIARLNADGSLDTAFSPGAGPDGFIGSILVQGNGKVLVAGDFTAFDGVGRNRIARLNEDGSLDRTFDPGAGSSSYVASVALQRDGKVLAAGLFTTFDGVGRNYVVRLNIDGTLDEAFDAGPRADSHPGTWIDKGAFAVAVQEDGQIVIGGEFGAINGVARAYVARLLGDKTDVQPPELHFEATGTQLLIRWIGPAFSLQSAPVVGGDYTTIPDATSPHAASMTSTQRFFRLKTD